LTITDLRVKLEKAQSEYERGFDDGFILRKEKDEGANKDTGYEYTDGYEDGYKAGMEEKKPWVGLTDEEVAKCWSTSAVASWKNIEAKLREKNGG
jgi:flagellar biosynthesis/type III secretory pathway protein FliH